MTEPERIADGRYLVIDGRRWRASDPEIPANLRAELVQALMAARRLVRTDPTAARPRVQQAKVALGERGEPWWEPTDAGQRVRLRAAYETLLQYRDPRAADDPAAAGSGSVCPSEPARIVGGPSWRELMPASREIAGELRADGRAIITQRGEPVGPDVKGPIRVARPAG